MRRRLAITCVIGLGIALSTFGIRIAQTAQAGTPPVGEAVSDYPEEPIMYSSFGPNDSQLFIASGDGQNIRPLLAKSGFDYNPSLSADGQWITFTSERGGSPDIYRVHPDGTGVERLTDDPAYDDRGVLSPDGRWLAFVSTRDSGNANIWLLDLRTRKLKNLTAGSPGDYRPAWSPDSSLIVFSSIRDAIPLKPGADGAVDAKSYMADIYLMRRDGTAVRRLTTSGSMRSPSWSRDGRKIVCVDLQLSTQGLPFPEKPIAKIVSIDVANGQTTVLKDVRSRGNGVNPVDSPQQISASRVAYVILYGASGFTDGEVAFSDSTAAPQGEFGSPRWSADGRLMVFHRVSNGANSRVETPSSLPSTMAALAAASFEVFSGSSIAFKVKTSLDSHFRVMRAGMFPSSRWLGDRNEIVMNGASAGASNGNAILAVSPDGASRRAIFDDPTRNAEMPAVSPRGDEIAFGLGQPASQAFGPRGPTHLALIRADGSGLRELPVAGEGVGFPSWSPDGASIVYSLMADGRTAGNSGLRIIELQSGRVTTVTTGPDAFPSWSPAGDRIVFARSPRSAAGASQIFTIRPDGSGLTRLTLSPGAQDAHPSWSPDGRWIAFSSSRLHPRDENLILNAHHLAGGQIFVMRADGTDVRQLTDTPPPKSLPAWLPVQVVPK